MHKQSVEKRLLNTKTGFLNHFTGIDKRPWKDITKDFEKPIEDDIDFLQPALWRGPGENPSGFGALFQFVLMTGRWDNFGKRFWRNFTSSTQG